MLIVWGYFGLCTSSFCFCCPLGRCKSAQIQVQGCEMHLSSAWGKNSSHPRGGRRAWWRPSATCLDMLGIQLYIELCSLEISGQSTEPQEGFLVFNNILQCFQTTMVLILCSRSLDFFHLSVIRRHLMHHPTEGPIPLCSCCFPLHWLGSFC